MRNNKKENFSNEGNNPIITRLGKGEKRKCNLTCKKISEDAYSPINNLFLYIFLVLCICLTASLYLFYRFNANNIEELLYVNDVHKLKAYIKSAQFIEEKDNTLLNTNINGKDSNDNKNLNNLIINNSNQHIYQNTSK